MKLIVSWNVRINAVSVVPFTAQGCQTIVQTTLGVCVLCGEQRCKCCTFFKRVDIKHSTTEMFPRRRRYTFFEDSIANDKMI